MSRTTTASWAGVGSSSLAAYILEGAYITSVVENVEERSLANKHPEYSVSTMEDVPMSPPSTRLEQDMVNPPTETIANSTAVPRLTLESVVTMGDAFATMVLEINVTAVCARAAPAKLAPAPKVILVMARKIPTA